MGEKIIKPIDSTSEAKKPAKKGKNTFFVFALSFSIGMVLATLIFTAFTVYPRWNALVKAWNNYQAIDTLSFDVTYTVAQK